MAASLENGLKGARPRLRVGDWEVDSARNEVRRGAESLRLEPKVVEVLVHLARRPGEVVGREELLAAVWPGVVVGDDVLTQAIIKLRKAFGDDAHHPRYIETISKRGYRLIAPVEQGAATVVSTPAARKGPRAIMAAATVAAAAALAFLAFPHLAKLSRTPWPIAADTKRAAGLGLPTVAVLPLANLSGDPKREYFSDGVTEDIINALGRFPELRVMSRNAVQGFKGKALPLATLHSELGVRYIVQGSVREAEGRIRVSVELSDAEKGVLLASETYDGSSAQVFEIQDRIVRNVVGKLHVKLGELEGERASSRPESLEAYDMVLRARALLSRDERGANRAARSLLARAQQVAPEYGEIYTAMGVAEFQRAALGWVEDAAGAVRAAEDFAKRALASRDQRAHVRAHSVLAAIYSHFERYDEALAHSQRAIDLNPSDAGALYSRGSATLWVGRVDEAISILEMARRIEPSPRAGQAVNLVIALYIAGRYTDALVQADNAIAKTPRYSYMHAMRAASLARLGNLQEARRAADDVRRMDPLFDPESFGTRFADRKYTAMLRDGLRQAGL